jgi:hypothetical protein
MKRYLAMYAHVYIRSGGGMHDFYNDYATRKAAIKAVCNQAMCDSERANTAPWYNHKAHIYDTKTRRIVWTHMSPK